MERTSILLPEELRRRAARLAHSKGITVSELIRRLLDKASQNEIVEEEPAFYRRQPWVGSAPSDLSENHDEYLYDK